MRRTDEKVLESPSLSELMNGEITSPGRIQKRHGYVSVEDDQTDDYGLSAGTRAKRGSALASISDYAITDYNDALEWTNNATSLLAISNVRTLLSDSKYAHSNVDMAYYNGYYYVTATKTIGANNTGYLYVYDSDFTLVNTELVTNTANPLKPIVYNSTVVVFENNGSGTIYANIVSQSTQSIASTTSPITSASTSVLLYDVTTNGTYAYVAYTNNAGNPSIARITSAGASSGSTGTSGHGSGNGAITIQYDSVSTTIMMAYSNTSNGVFYIIISTTPAVLYSGTISTSYYDGENIVVGSWHSTYPYVVAVQRPGTTDVESYVYLYSVYGSTVVQKGRVFGTALAHKSVGYYEDDVVTPLFGVYRQQDDFGVFYTLQIKSNYSPVAAPERVEPIAKYMYRMTSGVGGGPSPAGSVSNCVVGASANTYHFAAVDVNDNVCICTFSYEGSGDEFQKRFHSVPVGNELFISGSIPLVWDGQTAREIGFSHPPVITDDTVTLSGGDIDDGTYNYIVLFKVSDNNGRVYRSLRSLPYEVVISGGGSSSQVEIEFLPAIHRPDWDEDENEDRLCTAELYRTEDNGTIYYKVAEISTQNDHAWFSDVYATSAPTITDDLDDSDITDNEQLYTTGGVLERCAPPPLDYIAYYDNRIWGIDSETGNIVHSSEIIEGEGPWFNAAFVVSNPADRDKPIAIVDTQSFLMVFYRDAIGAIYGQGYNDLGTDGNLTGVKILVNNLGCSEQKSIIKTPSGVIFKAQSGFHIIGYDGSPPQYIGGGVSDYDSSTVVSTDLIQDKKQARFVLSGTGEPLLIFNYEFNQWYVWGYDIGGTWCTKTGSCVIDNVHYLVNGDTGNTLVQNAAYRDGVVDGSYSAEPYAFSLTTPWIKLTGLQGFQRVLKAWILGTYESYHDLTVEIDYDYSESNTDTVSIDNVGLDHTDILDPYQVRIGIPKQRCQAIRFKITIDTSPHNEDDGATLTGLRLEYMAKRGAMRAPNFG